MGRADLWLEKIKEAGDDEDVLVETLEDIFSEGVNQGLSEARFKAESGDPDYVMGVDDDEEEDE